ncbi:MAG: hypothetical protein ACKO7N_06675, partial [Candidatus Nitrosotenuis sp.]
QSRKRKIHCKKVTFIWGNHIHRDMKTIFDKVMGNQKDEEYEEEEYEEEYEDEEEEDEDEES